MEDTQRLQPFRDFRVVHVMPDARRGPLSVWPSWKRCPQPQCLQGSFEATADARGESEAQRLLPVNNCAFEVEMAMLVPEPVPLFLSGCQPEHIKDHVAPVHQTAIDGLTWPKALRFSPVNRV